MLRLNWLVVTVDKVICLDSNTMARKRMVYDKALIEISSIKPLPSSIKVRVIEGVDAEVIVRYSWTPLICSPF